MCYSLQTFNHRKLGRKKRKKKKEISPVVDLVECCRKT